MVVLSVWEAIPGEKRVPANGEDRSDSRLAWLVEPQQHDVALQQPILAATTSSESSQTSETAPEATSMASTEVALAASPEKDVVQQEASTDLVPKQRAVPPSVRLVTILRGTGAPLGVLGAPRRTRPMSFTAQFVIAMVATMSLFTTLALASPVASGTPFRGTFQPLAGAVPWIPTPTPTPRPTPTPVPLARGGYGQLPLGPLPPPPRQSNPGAAVVQSYIRQVFGPWAGQALAVARCESGYDPNAWNPYELLRSHASGVFQILYPSTWAETPYWTGNPFDYRLNILGAYSLFSRDGHTWREWACGTILGYN